MGWDMVGRIEQELIEIDVAIAELEKKRQQVLQSDEEYWNYIEQYRTYYNDEPLSIRLYYTYMTELEAINKQFAGQEKDFETLYQRYKDRLQFLERILAA